MHATSLAELSLGRASHALDEMAFALDGASRTAATHSGASRTAARRSDLVGRCIAPSPRDGGGRLGLAVRAALLLGAIYTWPSSRQGGMSVSGDRCSPPAWPCTAAYNGRRAPVSALLPLPEAIRAPW